MKKCRDHNRILYLTKDESNRLENLVSDLRQDTDDIILNDLLIDALSDAFKKWSEMDIKSLRTYLLLIKGE